MLGVHRVVHLSGFRRVFIREIAKTRSSRDRHIHTGYMSDVKRTKICDCCQISVVRVSSASGNPNVGFVVVGWIVSVDSVPLGGSSSNRCSLNILNVLEYNKYMLVNKLCVYDVWKVQIIRPQMAPK